MFGSQKPQGRRQDRWLTHAFIRLLAVLFFCSGAAASVLDDNIAEFTEDVRRHSASINSLERNQLQPLGTRLTVFLTLASGGLDLDSLDLFIDNRPVASKLYALQEQSALTADGAQQLYTGHLATGDHELKAVVTARSADGDFVRREATQRFSKQSRALAIRLNLSASAPDFEPRVSFIESQVPEEEIALDDPGVNHAADREPPSSHADAHRKARFDLAESHRRAGRLQAAGEILAAMPEGYWAAAGYLNLASDFAREDLDPSRALVALRVAMAMAKVEDGDERSRHLHDQALLRAGYLAYRNGEFEKAIGFLESVSLDSPSTPQALYFHGLALTERGNHRAAMQSWHRARKFPLAYPGAAEAWIGMGRGYDLAGYLGQAGEVYLAANAVYESERVVLRTLRDQVRTEGAYQALVADAKASDLEWFLADSRSMQQPRLAYLLEFLKQPSAQRAVGRVAALAALANRLTTHSHDLEVFAGALESASDSVPESAASKVAPLSRSNGRYLERLTDLRNTAEDELDKQVLAFLDHQDQRMVFALNKTEQQIAHLYEYLALESLGGRGQ
ncbi:tetratricopeptide repeat protein [Marinobacter sp.]|uniref:tetratricopeptide repeat protein n=1 Tax=Marinobacter sp. TaxID=50741 RepID=UPI00356A9B08